MAPWRLNRNGLLHEKNAQLSNPIVQLQGYRSGNQNRRKNADIGQLWGLVLLPISGIPYTERISGDLPLQENSQVFSLVGTRRAWTGCLLPDSGWERSWWWNARKITKSKKGLRSAEHHLPAWAPFSFSYNQIRFKTFCRTQERTVDVSYYSSNGGVLPIDVPKSWIEECNFYVNIQNTPLTTER